MIGIDFIGPLSPEADDGSRYILTLNDYFTKWVEAVQEYQYDSYMAKTKCIVALYWYKHQEL